MLTINLCTRGRPDRLLDTVARTLDVMLAGDTKLVISIDDDDQPTLDIIDSLPKDRQIIPYVKPREDALGAKWNRALDFPADTYLPMADYTPYITLGFDVKINEAALLIPDGIGAVYTNMANLSFPRSQGITHKLTAMLGYMYPPYFPYWFVDHWLDDLVRMIDRIVFADVDVDPGPSKPHTQEMREPAWWATFYDAMRLVRREEATQIIRSKAFKESEWRKDVLIRNFPLHEYRSVWINDRVREMGNGLSAPADERYIRLREAAAVMLKEETPRMLEHLALQPTELVAA